jgi:hypothetical protein
MHASLALEYEFSRDGDDFGWLIARVETADFSGRNGTWVQWHDMIEYAQSLMRYPIKPAEPLVCEWGFGLNDVQTSVTKVVIGPEGATGGLVVEVDIANHYDPRNRCRTFFLTDYPALADFREQIEAMMRRHAPTAILHGTMAKGR